MAKIVKKNEQFEKIEIREFDKVILTNKQYNKLKNNYGEDLTNFAIMLLNDKIKHCHKAARILAANNHYQYFRRDGKILNYALEVMNTSIRCGSIIY